MGTRHHHKAQHQADANSEAEHLCPGRSWLVYEMQGLNDQNRLSGMLNSVTIQRQKETLVTVM